MTDRRSRFVALFVSGPSRVRFNATRAAEAAGYAWPGKQGPRLMTCADVASEVESRFQALYIVPRGPAAVATDRMLHVGERPEK